MIEEGNHLYGFGPFCLDAVGRRLVRDGKPVPLTAKAFDILLILLENSGHIVAKEHLMQKVWSDVVVRESTLAQNIFTLRKILGDDSTDNRYIETIPKYGYRFIAEVREVINVDSPSTPAERSTEQLINQEQHSSRDAETPAIIQIEQSRALSLGLLRRPVVITGIALALSLALIAAFFIWESGSQKPPAENQILVVLPFRPVSADARDESLEFGMAETLITKLSRINRLIVRPLAATRKYAGTEQDPIAIGRELKADFVLEGSLQKMSDRIRITARLIRTSDGKSLWSNEFDEKSADIIPIQDAISQRITNALELRLTIKEKGMLAKRETENHEAYLLCQSGRYLWNQRTRDGYYKAIEHFRRAILADPNYASAYTGLADTYHLLGDYSYLSPQDAFPKAKEAATTAIRLDNTLAEAHTSLAYAKFLYEWDWSSAEREFRIALALSPSYPTARQWYSEYKTAMGRFDEAREEIKHAQNVDPTSPILGAVEGWIDYIARDYDRAIERCRKALEIESDFYPAHFWIGQAYEKKELYREAIAEYEIAARLSDNSPEVMASLAHAYAKSGKRDEARKILVDMISLSKRQYISPYFIALMHDGLGDKDQALAQLEKAYLDRSRSIPFLKVDPMLDGLRTDKKFEELVRIVKLD